MALPTRLSSAWMAKWLQISSCVTGLHIAKTGVTNCAINPGSNVYRPPMRAYCYNTTCTTTLHFVQTLLICAMHRIVTTNVYWSLRLCDGIIDYDFPDECLSERNIFDWNICDEIFNSSNRFCTNHKFNSSMFKPNTDLVYALPPDQLVDLDKILNRARKKQ